MAGKAYVYEEMLQVGKRIRQLREAWGWTQEELAEKAGLNKNHLSEIENGKVEFMFETFSKIARALKVQLNVIQPYDMDELSILPPDMQDLIKKLGVLQKKRRHEMIGRFIAQTEYEIKIG